MFDRFFFFKQKTAYEMRISDWSSDVCSSDLFDLDDMTGALTVSESDYHKAKMLLAAEGLPKSAPDGNSMIDSLPMGASRAVEGEKLRSAREMDLARTIEAIDAVKIGRASCRERVCSTCRSRWSPYH